MSAHLQPFDQIIVRDRPALFLWFWNSSRTVARIRFTDTEQRRSVLVSEIEPMPAEEAR